ncbi:MAG: hypothetical protein JXB85_01470 [Anaerolineales bacterium]|nr:hypothetical protein [Anaerolineales bacterium]
MNKTWRILVLAVMVVSLLLAGCNGTEVVTEETTQEPQDTPTEPPAPPETRELPTEVDSTLRLDPAIVDTEDWLAISSVIYDGLTRLDGDGNLQPALATDWTVSDDGLDYILDLRQGSTFHSGAPFNADAVLANFNRWFDPQDSLHGDGAYTGWESNFLGFKGDVDDNSIPLSPYDGIEKVDDFTVLIHLNRPVENLLVILAQPYFGIVDPTLLALQWESYGTSPESVSGTGPYYVSAWTDDGLVLTPNSGYWDEIPETNLTIGWK